MCIHQKINIATFHTNSFSKNHRKIDDIFSQIKNVFGELLNLPKNICSFFESKLDIFWDCKFFFLLLITLSTDFCRKKLGVVDQKAHPKEQIVLRDHCKWTYNEIP